MPVAVAAAVAIVGRSWAVGGACNMQRDPALTVRQTPSSPIVTPTLIDVVIAAAGSGARLGADAPKAFVEVNGASLLQHTLERASRIGARRIVVTVPAGDAPTWIERVNALRPHDTVTAVAGGDTRQASVLLALQALAADAANDRANGKSRVVLVHDAARPCASVELFHRVAAEAARVGGAIPVLPSVDTLKEVDGGGAVVGTLDRERVVRAQTPQGFRFDALLAAHLSARDAGVEATDDAALFARAGHTVATIPGEEGNIKVTRPQDLEAVSRALQCRSVRVGYGYDVHPLVAGRRLVLGGVDIDYELGLDGHSDADALAHAVTDALLGAAGLGDIGQKFPAEDARWKDADSLELLGAVVADLAAAGFAPYNVDATVVAERPRLLGHLDAMRRRLAARLGIAVTAVNVKATRGEGLGPIGRGEGIAAHAIATVVER
jgi:2-C-methyl-D-erythritol 4-phosphate cytidylyltransferase/2-C-methyl-D-erythritol 2,4-cyclodiphosphate synthase